jgi:hypothetical protein
MEPLQAMAQQQLGDLSQELLPAAPRAQRQIVPAEAACGQALAVAQKPAALAGEH